MGEDVYIMGMKVQGRIQNNPYMGSQPSSSAQSQKAASKQVNSDTYVQSAPRAGQASQTAKNSTPSAFAALAGLAQQAKNVAVGAVIAGAAIGVTGCGTAPEASPGLDFKLSLRNGIEITGESPSHAEFRIKTHNFANDKYLGFKMGMYAHHAGTDLNMNKAELIKLMDSAGVDVQNLESVRGASLTAELLRLIGNSASPDEVKAKWADHIIATQDANADKELSWKEFAPLLEIPR